MMAIANSGWNKVETCEESKEGEEGYREDL